MDSLSIFFIPTMDAIVWIPNALYDMESTTSLVYICIYAYMDIQQMETELLYLNNRI
jgi:hypothetical protein